MLNRILNKLIDEAKNIQIFPIASSDSTVKSVLKTVSKLDSDIPPRIQLMVKEMISFFDLFYQQKEGILRYSNDLRNGKNESRIALLKESRILYDKLHTISDNNKDVMAIVIKFRDLIFKDQGRLKQLEINTKAKVRELQTIVEAKKKELESTMAIAILTSIIPLVKLVAEIVSLAKNKKLIEQDLFDLSTKLQKMNGEISQLVIFGIQVQQFETYVGMLLSSTQNLVFSVQILKNYLKETLNNIEESTNAQIPALIEAYFRTTENMIKDLKEHIK
jgi:hypothetical protein